MRRSNSMRFVVFAAVALLMAAASLLCGSVWAAPKMSVSGTDTYEPSQYIIKALPGTSVSDVRTSVESRGGRLTSVLPLDDCYLASLGSGGGRWASLQSKYGKPSKNVIVYTQPNYKYYALAIPNDEYYSKLWGMEMMNMPAVWDYEKGKDSVIVAVLDTGVAFDHPDLAGRCMAGYDFVNEDNDPTDDHGHGTHVSGTIAAQGNNSIGVCGVAWDGVKIMPVKVLDATGGGNTTSLINGLNYAKNHSADVVNMSLSYPYASSYDAALHQKVKELNSSNIILVAAAGNIDQINYPGEINVGMPAKFSECIAVASVGPDEDIAYYSKYGPANEVDIAAPGGDYSKGGESGTILSTTCYNESGTYSLGYGYMQGTSMAAPHVSGACAVIISAGIPPAQVRSLIEQTARRPSTATYNEMKYGKGIIDVEKALARGTVKIVKPAKGATTDGNPIIKVSLTGIDASTVRVLVDYADDNNDGIPENPTAEAAMLEGTALNNYLNTAKTTLEFKYKQISGNVPFAAGKHKIYVYGYSQVAGEVASDWVSFTVARKTFKVGTHLVAFPYNFVLENPDGTVSITTQPTSLMNDSAGNAVTFASGGSTLKRWIPFTSASGTDGHYATYGADDETWNQPMYGGLPTGGGHSVVNSQDYVFPAGCGFWLTATKPLTMNEVSNAVSLPRGFAIYAYSGWNIIGNPYPQAVAWRTAVVEYKGQMKTVTQAVDAKWLRAQLYSYSSDTQYKLIGYKDLLQPYTGYWLNALVGDQNDPLKIILLP